MSSYIKSSSWRLFSSYSKIFCRKISHTSPVTTLFEIGQLQTPTIQAVYESGQIFIHRKFSYRGVILFSWKTRIHDRDLIKSPGSTNSCSAGATSESSKETVKPTSDSNIVRTNTYYQSLIDARDEEFVDHCLHLDAITYLQNSPTPPALLRSVHSLDHVAHEDIIPYYTFETPAINHDLFESFFTTSKENDNFLLVPRPKLLDWHERHKSWLKCSSVYKETTGSIRVIAIPYYLGFDENQRKYWWRYSICIENLGDTTVQLRKRNWKIFSTDGDFDSVKGRGVIGREPILSQTCPIFQYGSNVHLSARSGHMWGSFTFETETGAELEVKIPPFALESKRDQGFNAPLDSSS